MSEMSSGSVAIQCCTDMSSGALVTLFSSYLSRSTSSIPCQFKFYTRSFYSFCISFIQFISWTSIVHLLNVSYSHFSNAALSVSTCFSIR
jgi:hypothetical protein